MDAFDDIMVVPGTQSAAAICRQWECLRQARFVAGLNEAVSRIQGITVCVVLDADSDNRAREIASAIDEHGLPTQLISVVSRDSLWGQEVIPGFNCEVVEWDCPINAFRSLISQSAARARLAASILELRQSSLRDRPQIAHTSSAGAQLYHEVQSAAAGDGPVLICGEVGVGKSHVAREIHRCSQRADRPLIRVDCSLYSAEALERELAGQWTGGPSAFPVSRFHNCAGGTLVLENLECVSVAFQKKLCRLFDSAQATRPGHATGHVPELRVLASTCAASLELDLDARLLQAVTEQVIRVPRLRERSADLPELTDFFLHELASRSGLATKRLVPEALGMLAGHRWQGNLQELYNVLERAVQSSAATELTPDLLGPWLEQGEYVAGNTCGSLSLRQMERMLIETTFARCGGNRERTAQQLGIGLRTLSGKLREYGYPPRGGPGSNRARPNLRVA